MKNFSHTLEDGVEQYAFPSAVNTRQKHFIDRDGDGPWVMGVVNLEDNLTLEEARTLIAELSELADFMAKLIEDESR